MRLSNQLLLNVGNLGFNMAKSGQYLEMFKVCQGLNNKIPAERFKPGELAVAKNIIINPAGQIERRWGYGIKYQGRCHSLFSVDTYCLFVEDSILKILHGDYTTNIVRQLNSNNTTRYAKVGSDIYYVNGVDNGIVRNQIYVPWTVTGYVGVDQTIKTYDSPPAADLIAYYNGHVFLAKDNVCWYSEPLTYHWFNLSENYFLLDSKITMLAPVTTGIFVGTEDGIYYVGGPLPQDFKLSWLAASPVNGGTETFVPASFIGSLSGLQVPGHQAVLFLTADGICVGADGGSLVNLTYQKLVLPKTNKRGAAFVSDDYYIVSL